MAFKDYPANPASVLTIGEGLYVGPNMARGDVREALQQLASDGRSSWDYVNTLKSLGVAYYSNKAAGEAVTVAGDVFGVIPGDGTATFYQRGPDGSSAVFQAGTALAYEAAVTSAKTSAAAATADLLATASLRALTATDRTGAESARNGSELALAASIANAGTFETTAAGLAATVDGQGFNIPAASDDDYVDLYINDAGVAVATGRSLPASGFIVGQADRAEAAAQKLAVIDPGTFSPSKLFALAEQGHWYMVGPAFCCTDVAGVVPAKEGDAVAFVRDLSGNNAHLLQATLAKRPILRRDLMGQWYLEADGVDDLLRTTADKSYISNSMGNGTIVIGMQAGPQINKTLYGESNKDVNGASSAYIRAATGVTVNASTADYRPMRFNIYGHINSSSNAEKAVVSHEMVNDETPRVLTIKNSENVLQLFVGDRLDAQSADFGNPGDPMTINAVTYFSLASTPEPTSTFWKGRFYGAVAVGRSLSSIELTLLQNWMRDRCKRDAITFPGAANAQVAARGVMLGGKPVAASIDGLGITHITTLTDPSEHAGADYSPNYLSADSHNQPALHVVSTTGKLLTAYCEHNAAAMITLVSDEAGAVKYADPIATRKLIQSQLSAGGFAYPRLHELPIRAGSPFLFMRAESNGSGRTLHYARLNADGSAATTATRVLDGSRPYVVSCVNKANPNRIDFQISKTNPADSGGDTNHMYHIYMVASANGETWHSSDGTVLALPITMASLTPYYEVSGGRPNAWISDVTTDRQGRPQMLTLLYYSRPSAASPDTNDKRYGFQRWTGTEWTPMVEIARGAFSADDEVAGNYLNFGYSFAGAEFDPLDASAIVAARGTSEERFQQAWRYTTEDLGLTWTGEQIGNDFNGVIAPTFVRGAEREPRLLYYGKRNFVNFRNFTGVRATLTRSTIQ